MTFAAAVPGPHGHQLDQIRLDGVSATGHHGVLGHERVEGQVFRADVVLHVDTRAAATSDDLAATVSYADVAQDVHDVLAGSPADLVETVAERIAAVVLARPAVHTVDVRVHKPQAPIAVPFDDVAVVVRRDRTNVPAVVAPVAAAAAEPAVPAVEPVEPSAASVADPLDTVPDRPVEAVLALGANLGDAQVTLRQAVTDVDRIPGVQVTDVSPLARTGAVGGPEQPDYLNAVLVVRTTLSPRDLLDDLQGIEEQHGRVREERWGPRTLDIDIVQYGTLTSAAPDLELPHPRANERAFVLVPWAEIAPDAVLGGVDGGVVGQLAATAPDRTGIRWLALDWLTGPTQSTGQIAASEVAPAASAPVPQAPAAAEAGAPSLPVPQQPSPRPTSPDVPEYAPDPAQGVIPPAPGSPQVPVPREMLPEPGPVFEVPSRPAAPAAPVDDLPIIDGVPVPPAGPSPHAPVPPAPPADHDPRVPAEPHPPVPPAPAETYPPFGGEPAQVDPFAPFGEPDPETAAPDRDASGADERTYPAEGDQDGERDR